MRSVLFIMVLSSLLQAQWKKEYSPEVEAFMQIVEEKYQTLSSVEDELILSDAELEDAMRKMYFAIADDPIGYKKYIIDRHNEWDKCIKEKKIDVTSPRFGMTIGMLENNIAKRYSQNFIELIKVPYFLKVKLNNKSNKIFQDVVPIAQTVLTGEIEEVIKGKKRFKTGDFISISYLETWRTGQNCINDFETGQSYFIPIIPVSLENSDYGDLGIKSLNDNNCSTYLILNDFIKTPGNYFGIAEESTWNEFKKNFIEKYIIQN